MSSNYTSPNTQTFLSDGRNREFTYKEVKENDAIEAGQFFLDLIDDFIHKVADYGSGQQVNYEVSKSAILDIVDRIDKRASYFHAYHKGMEVSEQKLAALTAYWFVKLRPITILDDSIKDTYLADEVNEEFAVSMIYAWIIGVNPEEMPDIFEKELNENSVEGSAFTYHRKLVYSLRYRAISLDAMLTFVESMTKEAFRQEFTRQQQS